LSVWAGKIGLKQSNPTLNGVRQTTKEWIKEYNAIRPHEALNIIIAI